MVGFIDRTRKGERALLVQPHGGSGSDDDALEEFRLLARSAGAEVLGELSARVDRPNPRYYIGSGKADELRLERERTGADLILVNHGLSPVQERNLEQHTECRVIDRTGLILDIFAQRARSHEGKLQVELAQLKHLATRLVRGWTHLERQRGGSIGLRGPGETQLETDRRLLAKRVDQLEKRLDKVQVQRTQARRQRTRSHTPVVALVGYTNAGKSTLFNILTGADAYVADQLFATLDPTVRKFPGLASGPAVIADTVGFVRDLPHDLVAAFRSTLSEAREADLLLHVVDAADPMREQRIGEVREVLEAIGAGDLPEVQVWNKIDRIEGAQARTDRIDGGTTPRAWVSAHTGEGLDLLRGIVGTALDADRVRARSQLPAAAGALRARLHRAGAIAEEVPNDLGWLVTLDAPRALLEPLLGGAGAEGARFRQQLGLDAAGANDVNS